MIGRALEQFCQILRITVGFLMALLAIPVGMQVISRYSGIIPTFLWTEELATFIFVWIVMIGSMIAVWEGAIQNSVMMRANLLWIYISVPLAGAVWALFSFYRLYELFNAFLGSNGAKKGASK